jgi:hypothetical protein
MLTAHHPHTTNGKRKASGRRTRQANEPDARLPDIEGLTGIEDPYRYGAEDRASGRLPQTGIDAVGAIKAVNEQKLFHSQHGIAAAPHPPRHARPGGRPHDTVGGSCPRQIEIRAGEWSATGDHRIVGSLT